MERILVTMNGRKALWEALSRSIALAERIKARLYVLVVFSKNSAERDFDEGFIQELERHVEEAKEDGRPVDLFIAEGSYEQEVIRFVEENKITLLVTEYTGGTGRIAEREKASLQMIRHRVSCRVEIVTPRKTESKGV